MHPPFMVCADFASEDVTLSGIHQIRGHAIVTIVSVVVVETTVSVNIPHIVRVARIGSTKPPIPGGRGYFTVCTPI